MTIELKPCPFCGTVPHHFGGHYVFCAECYAEGPYASDEAAAAWNTRADAALRREREPDQTALALVAAAEHTIAELNRGRMQAPGVLTRAHDAIIAKTPADAQAALTAIERAAYERGVRDAQNAMLNAVTEAEYEAAILALLTQEGR